MVWVPHDTRDQIVDCVQRWSDKTEIGTGRFIGWLDMAAGRFYKWRDRYGKVTSTTAGFPAISGRRIGRSRPSSASTSRPSGRLAAAAGHDARRRHCGGESDQRMAVPGQAGLLSKWNGKPPEKGTGFEQPLAAHRYWHIDVSYINISGTFYYLRSILDGCSRYILNWDLRESMTEADIEIIRSGPRNRARKHGLGSSPTTGRSSSPRTSRSLFGSRA